MVGVRDGVGVGEGGLSTMGVLVGNCGFSVGFMP